MDTVLHNDGAFILSDKMFNYSLHSTYTSTIVPSFPNLNYLQNSINKNLTTTKEVEQQNRAYMDKLKMQEDYFISILLHTDFEDGISNEAIEFVNEALENSMPTSLWIGELFNKYSKNTDQDSITITYGLLRIIAYIDNKDCFAYIKSILLLILESALNSGIIYIQEAALMIIETWRDKDVFPLLRISFKESKYLQNYANALLDEFSKDFGDCQCIYE